MTKQHDYSEVAQIFKILSNESRLDLLMLISIEPRTVGSLVFKSGLSQPLVSQHLRTLREAGLVSAIKVGKEVTYRLFDNYAANLVAESANHYALIKNHRVTRGNSA